MGCVPHACVYAVVVYPSDSTAGTIRYFTSKVPVLKIDGLRQIKLINGR